MENSTEARFYVQDEATIGGRTVYRYLIDSPIGYIHIVEWDTPTGLQRKIIYADTEAAERKFNAVCRKMLKDRMQEA